MLQIDRWKRIVIFGICALGFLFAAPNLFYSRVEARNDAAVAIERAGGASTPEEQAALAGWPRWLPRGLVSLGLDLRGGAHLLGEVHTDEVYKSRMDSLWPELRRVLTEQRATIGGIRRVPAPDGVLRIEVENPDQMQAAVTAARTLANPIASLTGAGQSDLAVSAQGNVLTVQLSDAEKRLTDDRTIQQSLEIVRRRVDEVGTREPTITRQGENRIVIQVPGIGSAEELKALIGTTAKLTFNPVIGTGVDAAARPGPGNMIAADAENPNLFYMLEETPVVTGEQLTDAMPGTDQNGAPSVDFRFNPQGARAFGSYTAANVGQPFAIVLDGQVISAPVIRQAITGGSGQISGSMNYDEANRLAVLLRAGALPAQMTFLEERTIGPELGRDSIEAGRLGAMVGTVGVIAYVIASYGLFGVFASVALVVNIVLILAVMSLMGATLTLPGIAGIVLTVGMAVDANVIIFERIREELRNGKRVASAISNGFSEAMSAIIDANVTTFIAGMVMFFLGSGPVKGFAVTLTIGLVTSVFTAIFLTRLLIVIWLERRRPKELIL
ncbi:MAG: protein translocase subunit SecD [Paracoccus sp. (in: a-proteobacteria)]|uniref:protein translocase subunit SecD n=1 Tax=Paracoccus sp. TaxID=267 RepID=UPI0026DFBCF7|nr:protein translocase subunit SecD [Paracoccus sp. (in: a-proteobacteria)]MDO5611839.1 protein translocase subunit SecD [Paracoccus sp. (in: a-proteobacteria)]